MIRRLLCRLGFHVWRSIDLNKPKPDYVAKDAVVWIDGSPVTAVCCRCYASK